MVECIGEAIATMDAHEERWYKQLCDDLAAAGEDDVEDWKSGQRRRGGSASIRRCRCSGELPVGTLANPHVMGAPRQTHGVPSSHCRGVGGRNEGRCGVASPLRVST